MKDANHTSFYTLDREYFSECFDESANDDNNLKTYSKAIALIFMASVLFAVKIEAYVAWFILCLGGLELLAIRYKRSWWITRQMLSRAAGSQVNIRIDDQGIFTESANHQQTLLWSDIKTIKHTEKGFVVTHNSGSSYLSKRGLNEDTLTLLAFKAKALDTQKAETGLE